MPGQAKNPGFADAAQREPRLESPDQPRWRNHLLEVRPESRAQKVWLYKQLFHAVKELVPVKTRMLFVGQVLAFTEVESDSVSFIWAPCRIIEWINIQAR